MIVADLDIFTLPSIQLQELNELPPSPGIYFVIDSSNRILYIGQTKNLLERWKSHHRLSQLLDMNSKEDVRIAWLLSPEEELKIAESHLIKTYNPLLNSTTVEIPEVTPSEVIFQELLKAIRLLIIIVGIKHKTHKDLTTVYMKYNYENSGIRGCAKTLRNFLQNNKDHYHSSSLKIQWSSYGKYRTYNVRPGSREHKVISRLKSSYNNHWQIFCNGILVDLTPTDAFKFESFKQNFKWRKLAGIKVRSFERTYENLVPMVDDPMPLLWSN